MTFRIEIEAANLVWQVRPHDDGGLVARCDALGVSVSADGQADLEIAARDAMHGVFLELFTTGDLKQLLDDRGWQVKTPLPEQTTERIEFHVPFRLAHLGDSDGAAPRHPARTVDEGLIYDKRG